MVMDDMFSNLGSVGLQDLPLPHDLDPVLSSVLDTSVNFDLDSEECNMDLEELNFDFEEMKDFGPWIQTSDLDDSDIKFDDSFMSDQLNVEDLEIKEAVRYDCMWSSYNHSGPNKVKQIDRGMTLPNSFYDSLLQNIETPDSSEVDSSSIKSEMDTDEENDTCSENKNPELTTIVKKEEESLVNQNKSLPSPKTDNTNFLFLDHCYNISSTHLDNEKYLQQKGPLTPPVSSDDEESSNTSTFSFDNNGQKENHHNSETKQKCISNYSHSLLKTSHNNKTSQEPKFSFRVNLKTDKSRSILKQKVKIIRSPFPKTSLSKDNETVLTQKLLDQQEKIRSSQSAIRKRRERSLKMQEAVAREVHNQMERQRRNELRVAFDDLKVCLPEISTSDKASKQQILDKAVETCKTIVSKESSLAQKKLALAKSNALLKEKLKLLQSEVKRKNSCLGIDKW